MAWGITTNNTLSHKIFFEAVEASTTEVVLSSSRETIRPQLEDDGSDSVLWPFWGIFVHKLSKTNLKFRS